jgi:hypothetical protein
MKDEEMAEEQIKKWDSVLYSQMYPVALVKDFIRKAFLAGLKAGRPKFHKVADGDLPKTCVQVLSEQGALVIYKGVGFGWAEYSPNADNIKLRKWEEPIAWCEIPKFKEE